MQVFPTSSLPAGVFFSEWKKDWTKELTSWHAPYTAIIDLRNHSEFEPDFETHFWATLKFFSAFFYEKGGCFSF